jgi:hypothetical protein
MRNGLTTIQPSKSGSLHYHHHRIVRGRIVPILIRFERARQPLPEFLMREN